MFQTISPLEQNGRMEQLNGHLENQIILAVKIVVQLEVLKINQRGMILVVKENYMVSSKLINTVLELTHSSKWRLIQMRT